MFIRVKKVKKRSGKTYEYAQLVHGVWKRKRLKEEQGIRSYKNFRNSVHNYRGFIGRVYRFENVKDLDLEEFLGSSFESFVDDNDVENIYKKLLGYELICRGFREKKMVYFRENVFVDFNRLIVHDGKNDVVVKLKDFSGYLCNLNLDELFSINKVSNRYDGIYLLKKLRMVGINLSPEQVFVLVKKMLNE